MQKDLKIQNEVKIKSAHLNYDEVQFQDLKVIVKSFFGDEIDFDPNKDWNISFALKINEEGIRTFTGSLKMTDVNVTGEQMQIFTPQSNFKSNMQKLVNESHDIESISISGSGIKETVIAKKTKEI